MNRQQLKFIVSISLLIIFMFVFFPAFYSSDYTLPEPPASFFYFIIPFIACAMCGGGR